MEEKKRLVAPEEANLRIDIFLRSQEPNFSRTHIKDSILSKQVFVNNEPVKPHYRLKVNDEVCWQALVVKNTTLDKENIPLDILYEDNDIIFINKPCGMVVHPGAGNQAHTLVNALLFHTNELSTLSPQRPGIVHRLDKDTSGVMVVAKNNAAHMELSKQFKKHTIDRRYIALVEGKIEFDEGIIDVPIKRHTIDRKKMSVSFSDDSKAAHTNYKVLKRFPQYTPLETGCQRQPSGASGALSLTGYTAVELFPQTGRTHQLRVHLNYLGHPILGDMTYGRKKNFIRLALHAIDLGITHPTTAKFMKFSAPLPPVMKAAMPGVKIN